MERLAEVLSEWLGTQFDWEEGDREIAAFSLALLISFIFTLSLLLVLSASAGVLAEALIMSLTSGLLRSFAGGAHFSTGWRCGIVSAVLATGAAWLAHRHGAGLVALLGSASPWVTVALGLLVAYLMLRFSPVDVPQKPITSEERRRRLRLGAVVVSLAWGVLWAVLLVSTAMDSPGAHALYGYWLASVLGFGWETFSVLPPGVRFVKWTDSKIQRMSLFSERREAL